MKTVSTLSNHDGMPQFNLDDFDLGCPIMMELPVDPVTAGNGRVCRRSAIENCFKMLSEKGQELRPPHFGAPAENDQLFPAVQHKNVISQLIKLGMIPEGVAKLWEE